MKGGPVEELGVAIEDVVVDALLDRGAGVIFLIFFFMIFLIIGVGDPMVVCWLWLRALLVMVADLQTRFPSCRDVAACDRGYRICYI